MMPKAFNRQGWGCSTIIGEANENVSDKTVRCAIKVLVASQHLDCYVQMRKHFVNYNR